MESLDELDLEFVLTRNLDLNFDEQGAPRLQRNGDVLSERQSKVTESLLRNDIVAPHVVKFSSTYKSKRKFRRLVIFGIVLVLSISSLSYFSGTVTTFSHEAVLDIESKNMTTMITTKHANNSSSSNSTIHTGP
jgi:hypothetical protein